MLNTDTIQISQELLALLSEIDEFKGAWRLLGTIAPERLNALRRVATIESIGSSTRIEGSKLTDREVERLLGNLEIKRFSTRDEQEVAVDGQDAAHRAAAWRGPDGLNSEVLPAFHGSVPRCRTGLRYVRGPR
jgi:Fic family protein